jgi:hypothetical protein
MNKREKKLDVAIDRRINHIENVKAYRRAELKMLYALAEINGNISENEAGEWIEVLDKTREFIKQSMIVIDKKF